MKKSNPVTEPDESKLPEHTDDDPGDICITTLYIIYCMHIPSMCYFNLYSSE